jgi:hypothetical protein
VTLAAGAVLLVSLARGPNEQDLEKRWERAAGFAVLETYPPRDANVAALRLESLAAELGIEMGAANRQHVDPARKRRWEQLAPRSKEFLASLRTPTPALSAPPAELATFIDEAEPTLRQVEATLRSELPRWDLHLERGFHNELPNLLGHMHLQRLLLVAAGQAARAGRRDEAIGRLEAADRLRSSLADDPTTVQQLIALAELGGR